MAEAPLVPAPPLTSPKVRGGAELSPGQRPPVLGYPTTRERGAAAIGSPGREGRPYKPNGPGTVTGSG
ncbi:hypothetical protein, partial [Streptomyces celluloflavus]|uniref:hypothetical protein n=1 Tax=Streptomyces celluloflavus TaxID=58344 RepID=UPI0036B923E3